LLHISVHEGDKFHFIYPETSHARIDLQILPLDLIVGEVIANGTVSVDLHAATLNAMEEDLRYFLLFLGKR
jgi:uncharacterized membrane protein YqiK